MDELLIIDWITIYFGKDPKNGGNPPKERREEIVKILPTKMSLKPKKFARNFSKRPIFFSRLKILKKPENICAENLYILKQIQQFQPHFQFLNKLKLWEY